VNRTRLGESGGKAVGCDDVARASRAAELQGQNLRILGIDGSFDFDDSCRGASARGGCWGFEFAVGGHVGDRSLGCLRDGSATK
jgi:hypothetical protein